MILEPLQGSGERSGLRLGGGAASDRDADLRKGRPDCEDAAEGADVLTMTDLRGVETHGVSNMLRAYVRDYKAASSIHVRAGGSPRESRARR